MEVAGSSIVKGAVDEGVHDALEPRDRLVVVAGVVVAAKLGELLLASPEDVGVVLADGIGDFHVGAVERAEREGAVHHELHVRRSRGLFSCHRDLLGDVGCGDDVLGGRHVVVLDENHADEVLRVGVVVDDAADFVDELDNGLRPLVSGGGLGAENEDARDDVHAGVGLDPVVQIEDVHGVEKLALVLVQPLDLHVVDGVDRNRVALALFQPFGETHLVLALDLVEALIQRVVALGLEVEKL